MSIFEAYMVIRRPGTQAAGSFRYAPDVGVFLFQYQGHVARCHHPQDLVLFQVLDDENLHIDPQHSPRVSLVRVKRLKDHLVGCA